MAGLRDAFEDRGLRVGAAFVRRMQDRKRAGSARRILRKAPRDHAAQRETDENCGLDPAMIEHRGQLI